jgi:hypothetical protein
MNYCSKCVYPIATVNLNIDEDGVCSSCKTFEAFKKIPEEHWKLRKQKLAEIINLHKNNNSSNYDCLIPVSGGKDSY